MRDAAMGPPMYYSVLGIPRTLRLIEEEGCVCRHLEYDQRPELHLYVIAQRRACRIVAAIARERRSSRKN